MAKQKLTSSPLLTLRPYQTADVTAIETAWEEHSAVLYQLPTGGGKSVVFSQIVLDRSDKQILILAHKRRLLTQIQERLKALKLNVGLIIGMTEDNVKAPVLVASIRTVTNEKRLAAIMKRKWDYVIIDEARHSRTSSYENVLDSLLEANPDMKLLGVDATPYRNDGKRLDKYFQHMICSQDIASLINDGYLANYRTFATPIGDIAAEVTEYVNDFKLSELSAYMRKEQFLQYVVDAYKKHGNERQAIIFAVDIAHAEALLETFKKNKFTSVKSINTNMDSDDIQAAISDFDKKKIQFLINVEMLTEGVDLPETGCIICARPTKSLTLYLQMLGRGTRLKSDGSELIIIDCAGNTEEHGVLSSPKHWSLNPEVDPNTLRQKNKVVAKKADGTFTDDIDGIDFAELVEMTPEEYITQISGGLEEAEKINSETDTKILAMYQTIADYLTETTGETISREIFVMAPTEVGSDRSDNLGFSILAKRHKSQFVGKPTPSYFSDDIVYIRLQVPMKDTDNHLRQPYAESQSTPYIIRNPHGSNKREPAAIYKDYGWVMHAAGALQVAFATKPEIGVALREKIAVVLELMASKIDIGAMQRVVTDATENIFIQKAKLHVQTGGGVFVATSTEYSTHQYFPKKGGYRNYIREVHVSKWGKFMQNVIIKYAWDSKRTEGESLQTFETGFIKEEKLIQILKHIKPSLA